MGLLANVSSSFVLGLLTPLTAVCVLPLYPGFLSYLSSQFSGEEDRRSYALFGGLVVLGVLTFMVLIGLVFTTFLQQSLTRNIEIISGIAFSLLGIMSIFLLMDQDVGSIMPDFQGPRFENPLLNAFGFGFFFGGIVLPCNPAFIGAFFARALLFETPVQNLLNFSAFGIGMGFPLLAFSLVSARWSQKAIGFLTQHKSHINRGTGAIMLGVSAYYLFIVFRFQDVLLAMAGLR